VSFRIYRVLPERVMARHGPACMVQQRPKMPSFPVPSDFPVPSISRSDKADRFETGRFGDFRRL
jgi:hypothetical protein